MKNTSVLRAVALSSVIGLLLGGCGADGSSDDGVTTIKVAYQKFGSYTQLDDHLKQVKPDFEAAHENTVVELVPIEAVENDYATKLALMNQSAATAPDVMYEDTFRVQPDADAGYLAPLDEYTAKWPEWDMFYENAKNAGLGKGGKTFAIPMGTDTRALWYNKDLFAQAGLPVPWAPKNWDEVLSAAETIKAKLPEAIPMNVYSGKAMGEGASMQGFEMLLYGTKDTLYDTESQKWVAGSQGFVDSLKFIKDLYQGGLGPTPEQGLDKNVATVVATDWLPQNKLAIDLDGSWVSGTWIESGAAPWPEWNDVLGQAPMPTQDGQAPGATSMSGGWTLAMGEKSPNKDAAWDFIAFALNKDNSQAYDIAASQIAVRSDVSEDPDYQAANPTFGFFSEIVEFTHFRPATSDYGRISNEIQIAMEAVMTGQQEPQEAAAAYDKALVGIVGEDAITKTQ
ncbi:extracellular solute-binding protein [Tessaracoccus antarcticus]|uniref:Extracellular solute-binding protein n=1 Tax=Tessaracoccus antarcticus TaxID=2479848 RepID=A0A3M0G0V0_9ACTN|nr:extracellular solute-binding protein [Tessaracoccus antarcticus]RMB57817.1 extracellular solute-binding protein [Tessaracoccus antarcticus]